MLNVTEIMDVLPHRYPFLLVDRITEIDPGVKIVGIKNATRNEEFFNGHFPGYPVMPGVLVVEHAAQVGGILLFKSADLAGKIALFAAIDELKFRRQIIPGDQLVTEVELIKSGSRAGKVRFTTKVDDEVTTQGILTFVMVDDPTKGRNKNND